MSGWESAEELAKKHTGGGKFLRLENDGDSAVVAFLGEPYATEVVWNEKEGRYDDAPPGAAKASLRVRINCYNKELKKVQVYEGGSTWFKTLVAVRNKYGLDRYYEMKRSGAKKDPKTTYSIMPEDDKLSEADKKDLAGLELHDLKNVNEDDATPETTTGTKPAAEGATISHESASKIVSQLKELDKSAIAKYQAQFGVQRIRETPAAREKEALEFVAALAAPAAPAAPPAEVDPFA